MKMFIALISSLVMFVLTWLTISFLILPMMPLSGIISVAGTIISIIISGFVAVYTFRASLKAKTGKLYKREKENGSIECENLKGPRARK